jgi:hypothetical protein
MKFKIHHALTAGLCNKCRYAHVHVYEDGGAVVTCSEANGTLGYRISRPVSECSDFENKNDASKWDMEKIAWVVTTDKSGTSIGFKPPEKESR